VSDLSISYLGLKLKNPLVASSSPLTQRLEMVKKLENAGIGAVILHSLFEEQITAQEAASQNIFSSISPLSYHTRPEDYLGYIGRVKAEVSVPVIDALSQWMDSHGVSFLRELQGVMSQQQIDDPAAYERIQYQKTLGAFHI